MTKRNIEVEVRAFITEEKFNKLMQFFKNNAEELDDDLQTTFYLRHSSSDSADNEEVDLRIMKTLNYSKVWLKKGKIHDENREEIEIKTKLDDFDSLVDLFHAMGYYPTIKWFRKRTTFRWEGIKVDLDYTKGYGHIIELEFISDEEEKDKVYKLLQKKLSILGVEQTPREIFDEKYKFYRENWKDLV